MTYITILTQKKILAFRIGYLYRNIKNMSTKNKKQFGVWMDSHNATIVGKEDSQNGEFSVIGHVNNVGPDSDSNEKTSNNQEIGLNAEILQGNC